MRVSPNGGKPEVLVDLNKFTTDSSRIGPQLLPDGRTLLFTIVNRTSAGTSIAWDAAQIVVQSLETGVRKLLIESGSDARYVPTGHIVYASGGTLFAVPFDLREARGDRRALCQSSKACGVRHVWVDRHGSFRVFQNGLARVCARPGVGRGSRTWCFSIARVARSRSGFRRGITNFPRVSPDGKRIAFETSDGTRSQSFDLRAVRCERGPTRLTFGGNNRYPIWSGDGGAWHFNPIERAIRPYSGSRSTAVTRSASRNPIGHVACARVVVSQRRRAAVQRDEGLRVVALDALS